LFSALAAAEHSVLAMMRAAFFGGSRAPRASSTFAPDQVDDQAHLCAEIRTYRVFAVAAIAVTRRS
jgi:hypothetical protein